MMPARRPSRRSSRSCYNQAPTELAPVVRGKNGRRELVMLRCWLRNPGYFPAFAISNATRAGLVPRGCVGLTVDFRDAATYEYAL